MAAGQDRVLVVYDSPAIRGTISLVGRDKWGNLAELDAPEETLARVREEKPALVVLCAMTAKSAAYSVCREIKQSFPGLPVMIVALRESDEHGLLSREAKADRALQLSVGSDELVSHMQSLIEYYSGRRKRPLASNSEVIRMAKAAGLLERLDLAENRLAELEDRVRRLEGRAGK